MIGRDEALQSAQKSFDAFRLRNPGDRFNRSEAEIVRMIANDFVANGVSDRRARSLINCFVIVSGKGWKSY